MNPPDFLIVVGGIIGVSIARQLRARFSIALRGCWADGEGREICHGPKSGLFCL